MTVRILEFPETKIAVAEHKGPPSLEHETARRLIAWRLENGLTDVAKHRSYGVHYTDPRTTPPDEHRVDFCLSVEEDVRANPHGIITKTIPGGRCAVARHLGSRTHVGAAAYLHETWLPQSGETVRDFPIFFHYVNVGPDVREEEMITDVYLPLE